VSKTQKIYKKNNMNTTEPNLESIQQVNVIPYRHEPPLFWISVYFAVSMWLVLLLFTLGLIIPIMLFVGLLGLFAHSMLIAWLKGNSVRVTETQFPDLYALYLQSCKRLGIDKRPEFYLAQSDGMLNAMATRFMRRDYVVLLSAVVEALQDRPQAIKFYMGHELAHVKRKHLSRHWWLWPGMIFPLLSPAYSRAREYTCDRHGFACCDNLEDAKRALAVLVAGPERWKTLNLSAFEAQANESGNFWMAVNELTADYPWLCKRMMVLEDRSAAFPRRSFFAWMIAAVSPRLGYGGAIIGFLYWLLIGFLILVLAGALFWSKSDFSFSNYFAGSTLVEIIQKAFDIESAEDKEKSENENENESNERLDRKGD
jgi:Zn-dependent protease with chaperone function